MADVTDDFNRADGAIGSNWTNSRQALLISSNAVLAQSDGQWNIAHWATAAQTFSTNQYARITTVTLASFDRHGPAVFVNGFNAYWIGARSSDGRAQIIRVNELSETVLGQLDSTTAAGDVWELRAEVSGATTLLTAYRNSVQVTTFSGMSGGVLTDSSGSRLSSGQPGAISWTTAATMDNFAGGDLSTTGSRSGTIIQLIRNK